MIKSVEGFMSWLLKWITGGTTLFATALALQHVFFLFFDLVTGNSFGMIMNIFEQTATPNYDLTLVDAGGQTLHDVVSLVDAYTPFQSVVNLVTYILGVEVSLLVARTVLAMYGVIPLKFT